VKPDYTIDTTSDLLDIFPARETQGR